MKSFLSFVHLITGLQRNSLSLLFLTTWSARNLTDVVVPYWTASPSSVSSNHRSLPHPHKGIQNPTQGFTLKMAIVVSAKHWKIFSVLRRLLLKAKATGHTKPRRREPKCCTSSKQ
jgi:hypothetical protein